jgi:hypothetical protein
MVRKKKGPRTPKGWIRKEITGLGTESEKKFVEREMGIRKQLPTKIKRVKKADKKLFEVHKFP